MHDYYFCFSASESEVDLRVGLPGKHSFWLAVGRVLEVGSSNLELLRIDRFSVRLHPLGSVEAFIRAGFR